MRYEITELGYIRIFYILHDYHKLGNHALIKSAYVVRANYDFNAGWKYELIIRGQDCKFKCNDDMVFTFTEQLHYVKVSFWQQLKRLFSRWNKKSF